MSPLSAIPSAMPAQAMMPRVDITRPVMPAEVPGALRPAQPAEDSFASVLGRAVNEINARQANSTETVRALHSGENVSLHQAVIAMEEASVSFQLMVEVRNKLLEAYQELMRMQM